MIDKAEITTLGEFFQKFRPEHFTSEEHYVHWASTTTCPTLENYIKQCFTDATIYISKYANNEAEFYRWKLELDTRRWEYERAWGNIEANYYLRQMHIDRVLIEIQHLGQKCDLVILASECCPSCAKHHGKLVSVESILKGKHLPYSSCKREDYCTCTYKVVPNE